MQSGMPIDRKPLPATNKPGQLRRAAARSTPPRERCPTCAARRRSASGERASAAPRDAEDRRAGRGAARDQRAVVEIDRAGIVRAADEGAQQRRVRRARVVPLRRHPRARGDAALCRRATTNPLPCQRMADVARPAERDAGGRDVGHRRTERGQPRRRAARAELRGGVAGAALMTARASTRAARRGTVHPAARARPWSASCACARRRRQARSIASTSSAMPPRSARKRPSSGRRGRTSRSRARSRCRAALGLDEPGNSERIESARRRPRGCRRAAAGRSADGLPRRTAGGRTPRPIRRPTAPGSAARAPPARAGREQVVSPASASARSAECRAPKARAGDAAAVARARRPCAASASPSASPRPSSSQSCHRRPASARGSSRPGVDGEPVDALGEDQSAEARRRLEHERRRRARELVRGGEAGDAAADDRDQAWGWLAAPASAFLALSR